jgi:hypothetical protein
MATFSNQAACAKHLVISIMMNNSPKPSTRFPSILLTAYSDADPRTRIASQTVWRKSRDPPIESAPRIQRESNMNHRELEEDRSLRTRWDALANPGDHHTEHAFSRFVQVHGKHRNVLNCAIPLARAKGLTDFQLPPGVTVSDCFNASVTGNFPAALKGWTYTPKIQAVKQLPQMHMLPKEHASLIRGPWFQEQSPSVWLGINGRHLRYNHQLWQDLKPKILQGVNTTLVLVSPQIGYTLTPHIQLEKSFMFLGSLARGLMPTQLFPAKYLYPGSSLGDLADMPAPIFSDILPVTGGFAFPVMECDPDPWRVLAYYDRSDRYYGYPFSRALESVNDFTLNNHEPGQMLLPNGQRVTARKSQSYVYATQDPKLKDLLKLNRDAFEDATGLLRGTITHDGLPYFLPVEMQSLVYAVILTHWRMELDKPGDLSSYTLTTSHAAIRGYNFYQRQEPYYTNFMRMIQELSRDPDFKTYPLSSHLTDSWLGGNLRLSNQQSTSERELNPYAMRAYYHQQLDWQMGILNLMNHAAFRTKTDRAGLSSRTGLELEKQLDLDGLAFHQMHRMLRFDSHLFQRPMKYASLWPDLHPGWTDLDQKVLTETLPKL